MNKYEKWYYALIDNAKNRAWKRNTAPCYVECHHVLPKSLGGTDHPDNLVLLTAREHCVAHLMLVRFGNKNQRTKMTNALQRFMSSNKTVSSVLYESCRNKFSSMMSERLKGNKYRLGKVDSEETRKKKSRPGQGGTWIRTKEHKEAIRERQKIASVFVKNNPMLSAENRAKVSASKIGRKRVYREDGTYYMSKPVLG